MKLALLNNGKERFINGNSMMTDASVGTLQFAHDQVVLANNKGIIYALEINREIQ